jgi:transcriptional regulator with XRE-family HTH domain
MTVRERTATGKIPPVYGQRLRRARRAKGWSIRELTVKSGLAHSTIVRAEQGQDPTLATFLALAAALEVPPAAMLADPSCGLCDGMPPAGFICSECGAPETKTTTETDNREDPA